MKTKLPTASVYSWRFYSMVLLLLVLLGGLVWHLVSLQVLRNEQRGFEFLQAQGSARTLRTQKVAAMRGMITDRHGEPLAVSTPVISLWANPQELIKHEAHWGVIAKYMGLKRSVFVDRLKRFQSKEFMYIKRRLAPTIAQQFIAKKIPGVHSQQEYRRFYPAGEAAAHLVGFTNVDDKGQEGLELAYDEWLTGTPGEKQVLKDLQGRVIKGVSQLQSMESGKDIALSIDLRLQYLAYRELKAAVKAHNAKSGSVVLLDVQTGEVLAMANQPSYNPNARKQLKVGAMRNRALTDQFEPGSTMKPLTVMAALEEGKINAASQIDTSPGRIRVGRKTLLDPVNYGLVDIQKILQKSSQVGITKISLDLEGDVIRNMFFRLGLGQDTGTGFPGEAVGRLPDYASWQPIVQANFAFGYGLTLTPLQLAQAYSVIANQGVKKPVSLLKTQSPPTQTNVVKPLIAKSVASMLQSVVQTGGTGTNAALASFGAAGKTGTIHKVGRGGYEDERYLSLFAGFAPADDPKVVAVVLIDEPSRGQYFGGEVAAPVFSRLVESSLRLLQVQPERHEDHGVAMQVLEQQRLKKQLDQSLVLDERASKVEAL